MAYSPPSVNQGVRLRPYFAGTPPTLSQSVILTDGLQSAAHEGWSDAAFGIPVIAGSAVFAYGFDAGLISAPVVAPGLSRINLGTLTYAAPGLTVGITLSEEDYSPSSLDNPVLLKASGGISSMSVAQATIDLKSRVVALVTAGSFDSLGAPAIANRNTRVFGAGYATQSFGGHRVEDGVRTLLALSADSLRLGASWVSHSPRALAPQGFDSLKALEAHTVGGLRWLYPEGAEMTQWGTRIIPEGKVVYPGGFAGDIGNPAVQLYTRYVQAKQFETNPDELRFGRQDVWNLRQIVRQDYDPNDGLSPPGFGWWTGVENRNKEPVPVGWLSERIGYQFIWNKASPILPSGIEPPSDAPTYKAGSVTHWQREVDPSGVDSFASERWHVVYNNADLLKHSGDDVQVFGQHTLENRSRRYDKVGNFDTMAMGAPMLAPRIRELSFESRYSIEPPPLPLPQVKLYTRYIEYTSVGDKSGAGIPVLEIRWTYIAPKWAFHPPAFIGEPGLRNVTPELRTGGANHEEFGMAFIRTQWRRVETQYGDMTQWGRPIVGDRRHWVEFVTLGAPPNNLPGPKVTKVGGLPDPQGVQPWGVSPPGGSEQNIQVPKPTLNFLFAYAYGFDALKLGASVVTANSIRVEPGYWELLIGAPQVTLKNRAILVAKFPDDEVFEPAKPVLSPHTIYAVFEAPKQAKENHPYAMVHYVDHDPSSNRSIKGVGDHRVTNWHRGVGARGFTWFHADNPWPRPKVLSMRQVVAADGWHSLRMGMPQVPGVQSIVQFSAEDSAAFGVARVACPPYAGPITVTAQGMPPGAVPEPTIEPLHRTFGMSGWDSLRMGASSPNDIPYQWKSLHVGAPMPTIPQGADMQQFGQSWVSLAVRDLPMQGWDSFSSEYDIDAFDRRMRVTRTPTPKPPSQHIAHQGTPSCAVGTPGIKLGARYIRPDGNAEIYRKGAP